MLSELISVSVTLTILLTESISLTLPAKSVYLSVYVISYSPTTIVSTLEIAAPSFVTVILSAS